MVGRQAEQRLLRHLLDEACAGRPAAVVVSGVAGMGKTALLRWLGFEAEAHDALVLRTAGDEWSAPFGAVRRLVASLPELAEPLRSWSGNRTGIEAASPEAATDVVRQLVDSVVDALQARARRRPLVVLVDDAHLLGATAASVLDEVLGAVDAVAGRQGMQLLAVLSADLDHEDELNRQLPHIAAARPLVLSPLDEHAVADMLASSPRAVGTPVSPVRVQAVLRATGGLPLLVETERDLRAGNGLDGGATDPRVHSIGEALRLRLDKLSSAARELLADAALLPAPWTASELAALTSQPADDVADLVAEAVQARALDVGPDGLRFAHPLLRAESTGGLGPDERARRHLQVAERLASDDADERALQQAEHLVQAERALTGDRRAWAAGRLTDAGTMALGAGAWHEASRFLTAALRFGHDTMAPATQLRLRLTAGTAAWFDHDVDEAERQLAGGVRLARRLGDTTAELDAAIRLALVRISERPLHLGRRPPVAELQAALEAAPAREARPGDAGDHEHRALTLRVEAHAVLAEALFASGEVDEAFRLVDRARRLLAGGLFGDREADRRLGRAHARLAFAEGLHHLGGIDLDAAEACFREGVEVAEAAGDLLMAVTQRSRVALVELVRGNLDDAVALVAAVEREALARRFWGEAGFAVTLRAAIAVLTGSADAGDLVDRARRLQRRSGHTYSATILAPTAVALANRRAGLGGGDVPPAERGEVRSGDGPAWRLSSAARALGAVEADDAVAVRPLVAAARWRGGLVGPPTLATLPILAALVEAGDLLDDAPLVASARPGLEAAAQSGVAVLLLWPATLPRLQAMAARHAGDLATARRHAAEALRLAEDGDLAAERAKVLVELARLARADGGDDRSAGDLLDAAARTFDACSMVGWLRRCAAIAAELGLPDVRRPGEALADRTVLTEDVVGSTAHNARLGDPLYVEVLRVHDRLVRARLREHGGEEVKHTGDGVNAVFRDATAAARCALALQGDMAAWRRAEPDLAVEVRCGLARGSLIPSGGDYHGLVQSQAARLCSLAPPGQVLVASTVVAALDELPDVAVRAAGRHELRGVPGPVDVFRLASTSAASPAAQQTEGH